MLFVSDLFVHCALTVHLSGTGGDGFPEGCPCGHDPHAIVQDWFKKHEVVVYSVGCEPAISRQTVVLLKSWSFMTGGRYVGLGNAKILGDIIINGASEEFELEKLADDIDKECVLQKEAAEKEGRVVTDEDVYKSAWSSLQKKGVRTKQVKVSSGSAVQVDVKEEQHYAEMLAECATLPEVRKVLQEWEPQHVPSRSYAAPRGGGAPKAVMRSAYGAPAAPMAAPSSAWESQAVEKMEDEISYEQVSRVMSRKKASGKSSYM